MINESYVFFQKTRLRNDLCFFPLGFSVEQANTGKTKKNRKKRINIGD